MMRLSHIFLMIIGVIVFLMVGCFLFFGVSLGLNSIEDVFKDIERLYAHRILAGIVGIIFIGIGYWTVKILIKSSTKDEVFLVENNGSYTSVAVSAVEDLVKLRIKKYSNVKKSRIRISIKNKSLNIFIGLVITSLKPSAIVVDEIREDITNKVRNLIGNNNVEINLSVKVEKVLDALA